MTSADPSDVLSEAEDYLRHIERGGRLAPEEFLAQRGTASAEAMDLRRLVASIEREQGRLPAAGDSVGPYRVLSEIGRGAMGVVYAAWDARLQREVALKVAPRGRLSPETESRFGREARALATLGHPNVVAVFDVGEADGLLYYAMERLPGPSLASVLGTGPLREPQRDVARSFATVARALEAAHAAGLVHRDVKPGNLLLRGRDLVLTDFGVTRWTALTALTNPQQVVGTPLYMAPEVLDGRPADPASDQWALAAVLYEALTGAWPPRDLPRDRALDPGARSRIPPPRSLRPDLDPELDAVVARGLAFDPRSRFASCRDLADALDVFAATRPAAADLEGRTLGSWRLLSRIGSGGMGTVYLAEGPLGRAAVKVVHPHLLARPGFLPRFRREAEAGRRIRHPNVAASLEAGIDAAGGTPCAYLVSELVEGQSLREALRTLGPLPDDLVREIGRQVAAGLAALHAAGVVHRDVKPENVLLTSDQRVALVDLGIARLEDDEARITRAGEFAGSLLHAAPEQFSGGGGGPLADLYAAGVLLYEIATGENPFRADEPAAIVHAHLHREATPADERNPAVSPFLADVVATLLAKDPAKRFASAASLEAVLRDGEASAWWTARGRGVREERRERIPVRRETALYGREAELALLHDAWDRAVRGEGGVLLLEGEAGIGKTRLVDAFVASLEERDVHVLYGSYAPSGGAGALSEAVLARLGRERLVEALGRRLHETPSLVPGFAAILRSEAAPAGAEPLTPEALQAVHGHLARALAAERPTLWIVDDLHFAPAEARRVVLALARATVGRRLLLLLTSRPGLAVADVELFSRLEARRIPVGRLSPREVIRLLRDALRSESLAERLGGRIAYKSDGVPFFVFEMLRALRERGSIREGEDGALVSTQVLEEIEVPSAVRDLVRSRLDGLSADERAMLDCGAVQGFEFEPDLVRRCLGLPRLLVLRSLAELERRSAIVRNAPGSCRFDHHQIQEVLYQDLTPDLRAEYHALLAETFAERRAERGEETPASAGASSAFLAWHALHGSRPETGVAHLDAALAQLERLSRNEDAVALVDRAVGSGSVLTEARRADLLLRKADLLHFAGRLAEERPAIEEALAAAERAGEPARRARAHYVRGELHRTLSAPEEARADFARSAELAEGCGDRAREVEAWVGLGNLAHGTGDTDGSIGAYERAVEIASASGDARLQGIARGSLARSLSRAGRYEEARANLVEAAARFREAGNPRGEDVALSNLAIVLHHLGHYEESLRLFERDLARARETGATLRESLTEGNLGMLLFDLGDVEGARVHAQRKLDLSREMGLKPGVGVALQHLANVAEQGGDARRAESLYAESLSVLRAARTPAYALDTLLGLGRLLHRQGRPEEARARFEEALALAREGNAAVAAARASGYLALLGRGDLGPLRAVLAAEPPALAAAERLEAHWLLWRAEGDVAALASARRLAEELLSRAPAENRERMRAPGGVLSDVLAPP